MQKISAGKNVFIYPMPIVLVGVQANDRANFMTAGWVSRANANPPMAMVGINKSHYTTDFIKKNGTFSVNIPSSGMREVVDYCGLVSGDNYDKSSLFDVFYGELGTAPMIRECPLCFECRLTDTVELPTNFLFIGEIAASYTEERYMVDGMPDIKKIDPLLLTMPDKHYWTVGSVAGNAWSDGKKLIKK